MTIIENHEPNVIAPDEDTITTPSPTRNIIQHLSIIIALPLFCLISVTLYTRGILKATEPPGKWLLLVYHAGNNPIAFYIPYGLIGVVAILMLCNRFAYAFYVLSICWCLIFIQNL
jgi:hypothetical protein